MTPESLRLAVEHQGIFALGIAFLTGLLFSVTPVCARLASASISNGFVMTCIPCPKYPWLDTAFSA